MAVGEDLKNKARDAFRRKHYDLAVEMYLEALRFEGNDPEIVEGFFQAARKARELKGKALLGGMFSRVSVGASRDPAKRMHSCFRGLAKNPENKGLLLALGEAAGDAGAEETAVAAYTRATEADDTDAEAWKRLGEFHGKRGRIREALDALGQAVRLNPKDQESLKLRKDLAAEGALQTGGFASAGSGRELLKDKAEIRRQEAETRIQFTEEHAAEEVDRLQEEIETDPDNSRSRVRLGEVLLQKGDEEGAAAAFEEALRLDPRNFDLAARVGDFKLRKIQQTAKEASEAHKAAPDDEALAARYQEALKTLLDARLTEYKRRVAEHPLDLGERFRLGRTMLAAGQVDEAAAEFQQTVRDPMRKIESLLLLAQCFEKKKLAKLAVKKIEEAVADFPGLASPQAKDVNYAYADILARTGNKAKARDIFESIYEVDITYRDVSKRLDELTQALDEE